MPVLLPLHVVLLFTGGHYWDKLLVSHPDTSNGICRYRIAESKRDNIDFPSTARVAISVNCPDPTVNNIPDHDSRPFSNNQCQDSRTFWDMRGGTRGVDY